MKTHLKHFASKINFWNLFIGIVIGFGVGIWVINALVPNADQLIHMYRLDQKSVMADKMIHRGQNPYMMGSVSSEKQFLEEMIKHHEAAVMMAQQVLVLNPRGEIKKLAEDIIKAQASEITMMKNWLSSWK